MADTPSKQLKREFQESLRRRSNGAHRPILHPKLTHLNADTTWLLQIPSPVSTKLSKRRYFNILIDPWLQGSQSDGANWFSRQWHAIESKVQTIEEAEDLALEVEKGSHSGNKTAKSKQHASIIDAVVISHEFTDHCHQETLLQLQHDVPVLATKKAAALIRSWNHFEQVLNVENYPSEDLDPSSSSHVCLPKWLQVWRLSSDSDLLYYHSAVMIAFSQNGADGKAAVIYTPHGIQPGDLDNLSKTEPPVQTLALLHGLHDISVGSQLNLGAHNALKVQRLLNAKYWVATHDEVKKGGGLVSYFLKRKVYTVKDALEQESRESTNGEIIDELKHVNFVEVGNGEGLDLS